MAGRARGYSPGDAWEREILTASAELSACSSRSSRRTRSGRTEGYVFKEWNEAADRAREIPGRRFIVPVIIDDDYEGDPSRYQQIPDAFRRLHFGRAPAGDPDADLLDDADRRNPCHAARRRGMTADDDGHAARQREPVAGAGILRRERARVLLRARP